VRTVDAIVILVYLCTLLGIGLRFAGRQKNTGTYFVANRAIPAWAMGLSLMATIITSITFVAYPGAAYADNWSLLIPNLMFVGVLLIVGTIVVPFFRRSRALSAYAYFGSRFGPGVRLYSSFAFAVGHFAKMGFVTYLVALTINSVTGWNVRWVMVLTGLIAVTYTVVGGIEAVVWTDVLQGFVLWCSILVSIGCILYLTPGGAHAAFHEAWDQQKIGFGSAAFNLKTPTIPVLAIYGFFFYLQKYTADQTVVQRYLLAPSDRAAVRGIALGATLCIPVWVSFMLIGTLLWSYYRLAHEALPTTIRRADQVFPHFLATHVPAGAAGLLLASFLGAAISMLASDINCISLIGVEDFYRLLKPHATDQERLRTGKIIALLAGAGAVVAAGGLARVGGPALSLYYTLTAIAAGGLAGLFLLAFLSARASARGAQFGIALSLIVTTWATLTVNGGQILDFGRWNFPWHDYLIGALGHLTLLGSGYLFSFLFPGTQPVSPELTLAGWLGVQEDIDKARPSNSASNLLRFPETGNGQSGSSRQD
jgi:SSS family solute:Na+ symporter